MYENEGQVSMFSLGKLPLHYYKQFCFSMSGSTVVVNQKSWKKVHSIDHFV